MEQQYTLEQVLQMTVNQLSNIKFTATQMQDIGNPILQAIDNLNNCIEAVRRTQQENEAKDQPEEDYIEEHHVDEPVEVEEVPDEN